MAGRYFIVLLCCFAFAWSVQAEPANVLVGDLTFTRPEKWTWEPPSKNSSAVTRFNIPDGSQDTSTTVRFYNGTKDAEAALKVWSEYFPLADDARKVRKEEKKINQRWVTYYRFTGTYVSKGAKPKNAQAFLGAIIPSGDRFVHVVLLGPERHVHSAESDYKRMIEEALKQAE